MNNVNKEHINILTKHGMVLIILFIFLRTTNQVLFKKVALGPGGSNYLYLFSDPIFYIAIVLFSLQAIVWLRILKQFALSFAYPFTCVTVITIMASGALFFGEEVTLGNVLGALVIMAGIAVIAGKSTNMTKV